jgi:LUD domain
VSTTETTPDRFAALLDEHALQTTVTALEEHGFSVEVAGDLDAAREAVLARIPEGSLVMTHASVTLAETGIADPIYDGDGRWESARNKMLALGFATRAQQMKAIGGQSDYALGSVPAVAVGGTLVIASASGSQPGREDPGDPRRAARPGPRRAHPPAGRLLNRRAGLIRPQAPRGVP